ncbi:MAG: hypothetical protein ACI4XM_03585 [Candidatus Coprovivens sp.]
MTLTTIILQILLTIPLTIILNIFQKEDNRRINQLLIPTIYTIIISALIPSIKENIFLIVVFEIFIRNFYITNIVNNNNEISNITYIIESVISIALSLFTYNYFISQVDTVIPNPEDIKAFIWFLIILYLVYLYSVKTRNKEKTEKTKLKTLKKEKIIMQYAKFKNRYYSIINNKSELINNLVYSQMIYEDYKTPKIYRNINAYIGAITKKETKYGIMQIPSYTRLSDEESIKIVLNNYENQLKNSKLKEEEKLKILLSNYKEEEQKEIINIYSDIKEFSSK